MIYYDIKYIAKQHTAISKFENITVSKDEEMLLEKLLNGSISKAEYIKEMIAV